MEFKVIREALYNVKDEKIGDSVLLLKWSTESDDVVTCIDDAKVYYGKDKETSYGLVRFEAYFPEKIYAEQIFYDEKELIKNG